MHTCEVDHELVEPVAQRMVRLERCGPDRIGHLFTPELRNERPDPALVPRVHRRNQPIKLGPACHNQSWVTVISKQIREYVWHQPQLGLAAVRREQ